MKRILSFFLAFLFIAGLITSTVNVKGYASSTIPDANINLEYKEYGYTPDSESWMVLWTPSGTLSAGQEIHLYNDYDGNDSITWVTYGFDFYINGKLYEQLWDGFYFDLHIPYESWHSLMDENGVIRIDFIIYSYYGHSQYKPLTFYAGEDVPPNKGCTHNELEPYDVPGTWQYKKCPNDSLRHYLSYNEYYQRCRYCHQVFEDQRFSESYTPDNSPIKEIHVAGDSDNCALCGAGLSDEAKYLSYLSMYIRLGDNPMYDDRITEPMHKRFHDAGYTDAQWENIKTVLTNADDKYRNIYLLSFFTYSQRMELNVVDYFDPIVDPETRRDPNNVFFDPSANAYKIRLNVDGTCNYNALELSNTLTMYSNLDPADFEHTFFHESGHAAELQPANYHLIKPSIHPRVSNEENAETSPFIDTKYKILEALNNDVKNYIAGMAESFSMPEITIIINNILQNTDSLSYAQRNELISKSAKISDYYFKLDNTLKNDDEAALLYQSIIDEYYKLTGIEIPISLDSSIADNYKKLLTNLFVEDRTYGLSSPTELEKIVGNLINQPKQEVRRIKPSALENNIVLDALYTATRDKAILDLHNLDIRTMSKNSIMANDIIGGVTNNKIVAGNAHYDSNYWYNSETGLTTYKQINEAWAEYYSAMIRNDSDCIKDNQQYFPTATVELEHLADEILDYYMEQFNMPSPPPSHHSQQQK